ncbi:MAG: T9SS type A sorting domain-containing protein [Tannerellaceae bacterium]|nr:T9SS type A sorting domain-containing protein [Tannerellaceae bacterium]
MLIVVVAAGFLYCQDTEDSKWLDYWTVNIFVGAFEEQGGYNPPKLSTQFTNPDLMYPTMFHVPDKNDPTTIISLNDYLLLYGEDEGTNKTWDYWIFLSEAIPAFWENMYKETNNGAIFPKKILINFVWAPGNEPWITNIVTGDPNGGSYSNSFGTTFDAFFEMIKETVDNDSNYKTWAEYNDRSFLSRNLSFFYLPSFTDDIGKKFDNLGLADGWGTGTKIRVLYNKSTLDLTTAITAHEMGHLISGYYDQGNPKNGGKCYSGINEYGQGTGRTFSTSGIYDLMHASGALSSPERLYGIVPFSTEDLINTKTGITYSLGIRNLIADENPQDNSNDVRIKAIRKSIDESDGDNVFQTISIPVATDTRLDGEENGAYVENQKFLIEYRNGEGFDNYTAMHESEKSKGILISHIINSPNDLDSDYPFRRIVDIEIANPFPADYLDPTQAWIGYSTDYNGDWFMGKEINDWMDNYAPNGGVYPWEGGKSTWHKATTMHNQSLPTDFFNDTDRNKFTPSTRPNTNSWKNAETNIGVFIDKIEGDYADLRIYRNYYSVPLTDANAKDLPNGEKGLTIADDGYIGENFYIGTGKFLYLGGGTSPIQRTTLVPGTNMLVKNTGRLSLKDDSKLRLENSSLSFLSGAIFSPVQIGAIEIDNSLLSFEDGAIIEPLTSFTHYSISVTGQSSFYNSAFSMAGPSLLTLDEGSKFTILSGSNITMSSLSNITLKDGAELVIEEGANLIFQNGARIIIEGNAKITGYIANCYASIIVNDNSKLTFGTGSNVTLTYNETNSITGGINSEVVVESGALLNFNPTTPCVMGEESKITVQYSGSLYAYENSFSGSPVWNGIIAEVGSNVSLVSSRVKNAQVGLSAIGANVNVNWSSFVDCYNGVSLTNCTGYTLNNNYFKGMYSGYDSGISLTECGGSITGNTVTNFGRGVILTLSSVNLIKNKINANRLSGVYVTGYNVPQMINASGNIELNNEVKNNGDVQVLLVYHANVYLTDGYNNIYSDPVNVVPDVPCIYTAGWQLEPEDQLDGKALLPNVVSIHAERNYWGYSGKISDNFDSFFGVGINTLHQGYSLTYEPYAVDPYTAEPGINPRLSSNEPPTAESNLLSTALMLEDKGNIKPAIKKYEQILSKYPDSPEAYVANARLPEVYLQAERDVNELLMAYDDAIASDLITDKKFFKQMKISANTKSAKYDDAITVAEEMKAEAQNEAEVTLAEISIAIAETMKNNGKSNVRSNSNTISELLAKLTGKNGEEQAGEPSDIAESVLPSQHELFQNYPNPFNPVTQIKFALAETADVKLSVYNISGQLVSQLTSGVRQAGVHKVDFDGSRLNSGIYYYTLEVDGKAMTKKMVLTK